MRCSAQGVRLFQNLPEPRQDRYRSIAPDVQAVDEPRPSPDGAEEDSVEGAKLLSQNMVEEVRRSNNPLESLLRLRLK